MDKGPQGASSLDVWQGKILPVVWTRRCGQTQLCGKMLPGMWTRRCGQTQLCGKMLPNHFFSIYFFCTFSLQFSFSVYCFFCEHIFVQSNVNIPAVNMLH
jgi:hypothetical protein